MLISVIIPLYNNQNLVSRCVESVLSQISDFDFEIIIINDGSTDNSLKIVIDRYQNIRNVSIIDKKNEGVSKTKNLGISLAKGKYIMFLDSDDFIFSGTLKNILQFLNTNSVDLFIFKYGRVSEHSFEANYDSLTIFRYTLDDYLKNHFPTGLAITQIYNRKVLESVRFKNFKYYEDIIFFTDSLEFVNEIVYYDCTVYAYYNNSQSVMNNLHETFFNNLIEVIHIIQEKARSTKNLYLRDYYELAEEYLVYILIIKALKNKRYLKFICNTLAKVNFKKFIKLKKSKFHSKKFKLIISVFNIILSLLNNNSTKII
ncbi:MAG: glycosyltransferase [Myroides sp.]